MVLLAHEYQSYPAKSCGLKVDRKTVETPQVNVQANQWRRSTLAIGSTLCAALLATACGSSSSTPAPSMTPKVMVTSALANAVNAGWVHEVGVTHLPGHSLTMVNDIGTVEGRQVINSNGAHSTVLAINNMAYIDADAASIASYFQLPTSTPQQFAGQWLSIPPTASSYFNAVSASVTLASDFHNVTFAGPFSAQSESSHHGVKVIPIEGHVAGPNGSTMIPATLYVTATGRTLPVELSASKGQISETVEWTHWGQPVSLAVPSTTVPISTVLASGSTTTA